MNLKQKWKGIPVFLVAVVALSTFGAAALLEYYGTISTTVEVEQSILVDGQDYTATINDVIEEDAPGGEEFCFKHWLKNQMSVEGTVGLETSYSPEGEGIETTYYTMPETTTLILENKEIGNNGCGLETWKIIDDGRKATITFDTVNPTFDYDLEAVGLELDTQYALIYYADYDPRFDTWGGDNPGAVIEIFTTDTSGDYSNLGASVELNMNLPSESDWNINPNPDYCDCHNTHDDYEHCRGAKLWIVPTSHLTNGDSLPLVSWDMSKYLFETDLVTYFDCNIDTLTSNYPIGEYGIPTTEITLESGEEKPFFICYGFDPLIKPKTYTITTEIVPPTQ